MAKMTIVQLGVIIFAICISTQQVLSQNNTTPANNSTSSPMNSTMVTPTNGNSTNSTSAPTGAGVTLHDGTFSSLMPLIAVGLTIIQRFC